MDVALELKPKAATGGVNWAIAGTGFGLAVVVGAVAGALGGVSTSKKSTVDELAAELDATNGSCPPSSTSDICTSLRDAASAKDTLQNAAVGLGITGGVLLVGTIIYTAVAASQKTEPVAVVPWLGPSVAGFGCTGSF